MTTKAEWRIELERALKRLEETPAAPRWMTDALRQSLAVANVLAPTPPAQDGSPQFFYPH